EETTGDGARAGSIGAGSSGAAGATATGSGTGVEPASGTNRVLRGEPAEPVEPVEPVEQPANTHATIDTVTRGQSFGTPRIVRTRPPQTSNMWRPSAFCAAG